MAGSSTSCVCTSPGAPRDRRRPCATCTRSARRVKGQYGIEVIDLLVNPQLAKGDQILAVPTLVRLLPPPVKKIIGDLSNIERVLVGLDMRTLPRKALS